ncbi:MCE family protein [Mycobacterium sp.]|uniref:MCE family protein n=1 Tax=Mycobacterium sp. TaxID=1785 RepID=UPI002DACBCD2|nr:MCE family protein [Mycobacterium sp.]
MPRNRFVLAVAAVLVGLISAASVFLVRETVFRPTTISAYFAAATAIYPGDQVRVAGVKVGHIASIQPQTNRVKLVMNVDRGVLIPADAQAVIVAANLVAARYVELTPAHRSSGPGSGGPTMPDGGVIPIERTAVPVEWDEVKAQLMRLATDLGPSSDVSTPSVARFIDSAASALAGNGDKLRQTLSQLSGVGRILADGSGNIVDTINNLQVFVTALRDSNQQIVQFQDHFATLTSVVDNNRSDLDAALTNLSTAVGEVQRFIAETRDKTSEQVQRLANVTTNLAEHRNDLEQLLHVAGPAISNGYADYNADTGTILGSVSLTNFSNPLHFFCSAVGAVKNTTAPETAKLCAQYLGPALRLLNFNNLPIPINPYLSPAPRNLIYTDPNLAPGDAGAPPGPPESPESPPAFSAYTGLNGDVPPPPGWNQPVPPPGLNTPLPAFPSPAVYPGAPPPAPPSVENLLLPPSPPAAPAPAGPPGPAPSDGAPPS